METPICDFVQKYVADRGVRMHMPGHKGRGPIGCEPYDITEILGADSLYEADGIIRESEAHAAACFGCPTYYSTEGSSHCIRAMLYLAVQLARERGLRGRPVILAARNVHKVFVSATALLDADVAWLYPSDACHYLSCPISADDVEKRLDGMAQPPAALYLTSPDYLGHVMPIDAIAEVCRRRQILLLVDNAHGAYFPFDTVEAEGNAVNRHPIAQGADMCCDSAHKTLPVLTGGAYLHLSPAWDDLLGAARVKNALSVFGSTSPSYVILQSLDAANALLSTSFPAALKRTVPAVAAVKRHLRDAGYEIVGDESMKITIRTKSYGYEGHALADLLRADGIECEFSDRDYLVLMPGAYAEPQDLARLERALISVLRREPIESSPPSVCLPEAAMTVREAMMAPSEALPVDACVGRVLATVSVACPPAVPIVVSGEIISPKVVSALTYYGISHCRVVKTS